MVLAIVLTQHADGLTVAAAHELLAWALAVGFLVTARLMAVKCGAR